MKASLHSLLLTWTWRFSPMPWLKSTSVFMEEHIIFSVRECQSSSSWANYNKLGIDLCAIWRRVNKLAKEECGLSSLCCKCCISKTYVEFRVKSTDVARCDAPRAPDLICSLSWYISVIWPIVDDSPCTALRNTTESFRSTLMQMQSCPINFSNS